MKIPSAILSGVQPSSYVYTSKSAPWSAKRGSNEITQFLADHGADFDVYTYEEGWTPLRIADGIFIGGTVKRADETAALLRKLMTNRGLQPPAKIANDVADPYGRDRPEVAAAKAGK